MIYYIVTLFLFLFSLLNQFNLKKRDVFILGLISFSAILVIGGLRYNVGTDWNSYEKLFNNVKNISGLFKLREEKGFMLFMYIIKLVTGNYCFFIFIVFLFSFAIKFKLILEYSSDIFLSLSFYFFTIFLILDVNQLRQGLALSIIFLSVKYILEKNLKIYLFLIGLAFCFHTSAIVFLPFYWISRIKLSDYQVFIIVFLSIIISIPIRDFMLNNIAAKVLFSVGDFSKYNVYMENKSLKKDSAILSIGFLQRMIVFVLYLIYYKMIKANENIKNFLKNGYLIGIIIFIVFSFNAQFATRLGYYYKWCDLLMVAFIVSYQKNIFNKLILIFLFFIICIIGIQRLLGDDGGSLLPYSLSIW